MHERDSQGYHVAKRKKSKVSDETENTLDGSADAVETAGGPEASPADDAALEDTNEGKDTQSSGQTPGETSVDQGSAEPGSDEEHGGDTAPAEDDAPRDEEADAPEEAPASDDGEDVSEDVSDEARQGPEPFVPPAQPVERVVEQKSSVVPMIFGGVIAAGLGFVAAQYGLQTGADDTAFETETRQVLETQSAAIAALESTAESTASLADLDALSASLPDAPDLSGVETTLAEITAALETLDTRLTELEKRPVTESVSPEAIAAYERELESLRTSVAAQRAEIETIAADAANKESEASEMARATLARAALTRVISAIDSGAPFDGPLGELAAASGEEIPAALSSVAADGVPALAALQEVFPDAARAALAATRAEASDGAGGLGTFLARQLGARSVTPREGDDPDAVLSRAEAAVRDGRLTDALAEIEILPEAGRALMADWVNAAGARRDAQAAAEALSTRLSDT